MNAADRTINAAKLNADLKEVFNKVIDKFTAHVATATQNEEIIGHVAVMFRIGMDGEPEFVTAKIKADGESAAHPALIAAINMAEIESMVEELGDGIKVVTMGEITNGGLGSR